MLSFISRILIGPFLPVFLILSGLYMNIRLRFLPFTKVRRIAATLTEPSDSTGVSPRKALCLALAGTLGVGNIVGVATAITAGGAGAIFWMWISAVFSMILKYAETVLALKKRKVISPVAVRDYQGKGDILSSNEELTGGAMYFIKNRFFALLFAIFCIIASFTVGNLIQTSAVSVSFREVFGIPSLLTGCILALITVIIITRGAVIVSSFCAIVIPLLSGMYIVMTLAILLKNASALPGILSTIFRDAFSLKAAGGGIGSSLLLRSMRIGFSRGLVTNEAGCGTAPIAHASAQTNDPVKQGFLGIIEVFFDTIVLCSLTAFVVLIAQQKHPELDGMSLVNAVFFDHFGRIGSILLSVSVFLFVIATLVGWSFYGRTALRFLFSGRRIQSIYCLLFSAAVIWGASGTPDFFWILADISCAVMTFINTTKVIFCADEICQETSASLNALP